METGEVGDKTRLKDTDNKEFWLPILKNEKFQNYIKNTYQVASDAIIKDDEMESFLDA
jgi:hypothetical protein